QAGRAFSCRHLGKRLRHSLSTHSKRVEDMNAKPPHNEKERAITRLRKGNRREKRRREQTILLFPAAFILLTCGLMLSSQGSQWGLLYYISSLLCATIIIYNLLQNRVNPALRCVIELDDVQAIEVLLETLEICHESEYPELLRAVSGLLLRLTPAD